MTAPSTQDEEKTRQFLKREKRRSIRQFHDAIKKDDLEKVKAILDTDIEVNFQYAGVSALQIAVTNGNADMCRLLIEHDADVDKKNSDENTLLNMATWRGFTDVAHLLILNGADMDVSNNHDATPLSTAAYKGYPDIARVLIQAQCDLNKSNMKGQSPLACAAAMGHSAVVQQLIDAGSDLNWQDHQRRTPLIIAAQKGHVDIVKMLIDAGSSLDIAMHYGYTALYCAAQSGYTDIVRLLVQAGAVVDKPDSRGCTPLLEAVKHEHREVMDLLIQAKCDLNKADIEFDQAPIHAAIRLATQYFGEAESQIRLVHTLVSAGCNLNVQDKAGWSPVFQAAFGGESGIVRLLLQHHVELSLVTEYGDTPLHGAVFGNKCDIMDMLIDAGCDVNKANNKNQLPLYKAIINRAQPKLLERLLSAGSETDRQETENRQTPLFAAIQMNNAHAAGALLKAGCSVNLANHQGDTALWLACDKGQEDMVHTLLGQPEVDLDAGICHIPLHAAAVHGYTSIAQALLNAGCDVNKLADIGTSALYLAVDMGHKDIVRMLINQGANPSAPHLLPLHLRVCCHTYTDPHPHLELEPLYAAVKNDDFECIKLILVATPRMPYAALATLRDIVFRTPYARQAQLSRQNIAKFASFFTGILSSPRMLKAECRGVIRQALGSKVNAKVAELPLPSKIHEYLLLKDETILFDASLTAVED